jgi:lysozyme
MKPRYQVSRAAVDLIKRFEGYRMKAAQLPDGRWTLGYGHTLTARAGASVSEQDAEALLLYDLITVAHAVNENVYTPLNQNQFDALVCFAFNIGAENFIRSAVLRRLNEGALIQAACEMEMWRKADFEGERIVIDALVRRRSAEKALFLTPTDGHWVAAPSSVLRPKIDYDAGALVPSQAPAAITTSLNGDKAVALREDGSPLAALGERAQRQRTGRRRRRRASGSDPARRNDRRHGVDPRAGRADPGSGHAGAAGPGRRRAVAVPLRDPRAVGRRLALHRAVPIDAGRARRRIRSSRRRRQRRSPNRAPPPSRPCSRPRRRRPPARCSIWAASRPAARSSSSPRTSPSPMSSRMPSAGSACWSAWACWAWPCSAAASCGTSASAPNEGLSPIKMFGWGASVIGMICFATAAYLLMRRLGDPEPQSED